MKHSLDIAIRELRSLLYVSDHFLALSKYKAAIRAQRSSFIEAIDILEKERTDQISDKLKQRAFEKVMRKKFGPKPKKQRKFGPKYPFPFIEERKIERALKLISEREAVVLKLRYGLCGADQFSLREIGGQLSVSSERIRQIEAKALRKLKHPTRTKLIDPPPKKITDPINDIEFSVRAANCLYSAGLETVGEVREFGLDRLIIIQGCGVGTAAEIKRIITEYLEQIETEEKP